ncbi:MAG: penicillin acylase family protein [Desulfobacteraceae bacterium]|nr:penicillin acylase family protein [Desulfobacteraceae bacterium]
MRILKWVVLILFIVIVVSVASIYGYLRSGSILPGIPYVVIGANEHVAWGFTNVMADDADFYIEKIKPDDPNKYLYQGQASHPDHISSLRQILGPPGIFFQHRPFPYGRKPRHSKSTTLQTV